MKEESFKLWVDLKKHEAYKLALELGEIVWQVVRAWDWFAKKDFGS